MSISTNMAMKDDLIKKIKHIFWGFRTLTTDYSNDKVKLDILALIFITYFLHIFQLVIMQGVVQWISSLLVNILTGLEIQILYIFGIIDSDMLQLVMETLNEHIVNDTFTFNWKTLFITSLSSVVSVVIMLGIKKFWKFKKTFHFIVIIALVNLLASVILNTRAGGAQVAATILFGCILIVLLFFNRLGTGKYFDFLLMIESSLELFLRERKDRKETNFKDDVQKTFKILFLILVLSMVLIVTIVSIILLFPFFNVQTAISLSLAIILIIWSSSKSGTMASMFSKLILYLAFLYLTLLANEGNSYRDLSASLATLVTFFFAAERILTLMSKIKEKIRKDSILHLSIIQNAEVVDRDDMLITKMRKSADFCEVALVKEILHRCRLKDVYSKQMNETREMMNCYLSNNFKDYRAIVLWEQYKLNHSHSTNKNDLDRRIAILQEVWLLSERECLVGAPESRLELAKQLHQKGGKEQEILSLLSMFGMTLNDEYKYICYQCYLQLGKLKNAEHIYKFIDNQERYKKSAVSEINKVYIKK